MLVNPPQLVEGKFLRINDMVAYMDLSREVSYHSSHNLYVPLFEKRSVSISLRCHRIPLSVIANLLLFIFSST